MTTQETIDKLVAMRLHGFVHALREQLEDTDKYAGLGFEDRLGLLVDREWAEREARSLTRRLQIARLRDKAACIEDGPDELACPSIADFYQEDLIRTAAGVLWVVVWNEFRADHDEEIINCECRHDRR
jgi:hypothetical protein